MMVVGEKGAMSMDAAEEATNGKPTNLTERLWLHVRTKAFKNWFGDWINDPTNASKVVDENGEPLVVYHTSDVDFTTFDINKQNSKDPGYYGKGFYFSTKPAKLGLDNPIVKFYFLNIRNPWMQQSGDFSNTGKEIPDGKDGSIVRYNDDTSENVVDDIDQITAKSPNQIKSATDNIGTYSTENDDIQMMVVGEKGLNGEAQMESRIETSTTPQAFELTTPDGVKTVHGYYRHEQKAMYLDENIINLEHPAHLG